MNYIRVEFNAVYESDLGLRGHMALAIRLGGKTIRFSYQHEVDARGDCKHPLYPLRFSTVREYAKYFPDKVKNQILYLASNNWGKLFEGNKEMIIEEKMKEIKQLKEQIEAIKRLAPEPIEVLEI